MKFHLVILPLLLASCASAPRTPMYAVASGEVEQIPQRGPQYGDSIDDEGELYTSRRGRVTDTTWMEGQVLLQGFIGVTDYTDIKRADTDVDVEFDDTQFPLIGGGAQVKLAGERVDLGLEGMFSMSGRADASAIAVGGGGTVVAVDVDLFIVDVYGGPFVSMFLGEKMRIYGAAGPLLQFVNYHESSDSPEDGSGSGFGYGVYARTGFEFRPQPGLMIGVGARWSDSELDLYGSGDLDIDGLQYMITVSRGI